MRLLLCLTLAAIFAFNSFGFEAVAGVKAARSGPDVADSIRTHGIKINVDDMDRALSFYQDKLGFELEDRSHYPKAVILKSNDKTKLLLFKVKKLRRPAPEDTGVSFTLQVNDLDRAIETMKSRGVEFAEKERRKEGVGYAIFIRDPFGRRISLMHQTIVKVEPFKEPRIYNYGFAIPDMTTGRDFYSNKLGFVVRSEKYLPLDLPLGHEDKSFGFMLHYRPGIRAVKSSYPAEAPFYTVVFETNNLQATVERLKKSGVKFLDHKPRRGAEGSYVAFEDPFGNVSELLEVKASQSGL